MTVLKEDFEEVRLLNHIKASGLLTSFTFNGVYGLMFYMASMFCWLFFAGIAINQTRNKSLLFWCGTMITFLIAMAVDSLINANVETYIWRNYENIILCIHVCIILSLYKPRTIINGLVDELRVLVDVLRNNYAYSYFWYTVQRRFDKARLL